MRALTLALDIVKTQVRPPRPRQRINRFDARTQRKNIAVRNHGGEACGTFARTRASLSRKQQSDRRKTNTKLFHAVNRSRFDESVHGTKPRLLRRGFALSTA
jgi:hypothetical protein